MICPNLNPNNGIKKLKKLVGKQTKCADIDTELANQFNAHLASIVQTLPPLRPDEIPQPHSDYQDFPTITVGIVIKKLRMLKRTSVTPIDIPIQIMKAFPDELSQPLSNFSTTSPFLATSPLYGRKDM
jgi:hypothetical protein